MPPAAAEGVSWEHSATPPSPPRRVMGAEVLNSPSEGFRLETPSPLE